MTRLFSAFPLPTPVADHLAAHLGPQPKPTDRVNWHLTVGFYGETDPDECLSWLVAQVRGRPAPTLRLRGVGAFPGITWVGVHADQALADLAARVGTPGRDYVPHVTVGKWPRKSVAPGAPLPAHYEGPEWTPDALTLYARRSGDDGPVYTPLDQVGLCRTGTSAPTC